MFGKLIVACNQISSDKTIHYSAIGIYFLGAFSYAATQFHISRYYCVPNNILLDFIRAIFCMVMVIAIVAFTIFSLPNMKKGYHVAQIAEWVFLLNKYLFMLTFMIDFWKIGIGIEVGTVRCEEESPESLYERSDMVILHHHNSVSTVNNYYDRVYFPKSTTSGRSSQNL